MYHVTWCVDSNSKKIDPSDLVRVLSSKSGLDQDAIDLKRTVVSEVKFEEYFNPGVRIAGFSFDGVLGDLTSNVIMPNGKDNVLSVLMPKTSTSATVYSSRPALFGQYDARFNPPSAEVTEQMIERIHIDQDNRCTVEPDNTFYPRVKHHSRILDTVGHAVTVDGLEFKQQLQDHFYKDAIIDLSDGLTYNFHNKSEATSLDDVLYVSFTLCIGVVTKNSK
jgi:hypothetical protein